MGLSDDRRRSLYLYAHTVARMNPHQVVGVFDRKVREFLVPRLPVDFDRRYERRVPEDLDVTLEPFESNSAVLRSVLDEATRDRYRTHAEDAAAGEFTFMNRTLTLGNSGSIEWYDERLDDLPRLWRLKLYSFQPLSWVVLGLEPDGDGAAAIRRVADEWIRDWMRTVNVGGERYLRRAWTPYAVSLRLLNWIRYLAWRTVAVDAAGDEGDREFEAAVRSEIFKTGLFLRNHIEWDVGGNHLVENGAALVAAGLLFGDDGRDWVSTGLAVLSEVSATQFLSDGCHFERSPMYHVLVLTRFLTVCDLLGRFERTVPSDVRETAVIGSGFLSFIRPPDGRIPLLNDTVSGESLSLDACHRYARVVGVGPGDAEESESSQGASPVRIDQGRARCGDAPGRADAGYRWLRTDAGDMLVDGGPVGPPHLPGHAHSDTLSVFLWLDGQQVVTDTGTFDYEGGPRRTYARGVRGHNTVQVGDYEPISLGGRFLMGPRPSPTTRVESGADVTLFEGRYRATSFEGPAYTHHRAVFAGDNWWFVRDRVADHEGQLVRSRLHLHPAVGTSVRDDGRIRLRRDDSGDDSVEGWIYPLGVDDVDVGRGWYFPRFGEAMERSMLELRADANRAPVTVGYVVSTVDLTSPPELISREGGSESLLVDEVRYELPATRLGSTR